MSWRSPLSPSLLLACGALAVLLTGVPSAHAGDAYFLLMFASQRTPNDTNYSHTFATFVRYTEEPRESRPRLEAHTISWLPANGIIRVGALLPEEGHNWGCHETIVWALESEQRVSLWGPYRIEPELYERALLREAELNSGRVKYKSMDSLYPTNAASNCIHGVSTIVNGHRPRAFSPGWGETASYAVLRTMRAQIIDLDTVHPWVGSALGLDRYPIIYRPYEHPRSGTIRGPLSEFLGRDRDATPSYGPPR